MKRHIKTTKKTLLESFLAKNSALSWRSLFSFVSIMITSTVLLCFAKIQSSEWVSLIQWIGAIFITGEAARKFVSKSDSVSEDEVFASQEAENS